MYYTSKSSWSRKKLEENSFDISVFLWIPPVAFRYPEINTTEAKAENVTSVAFTSGNWRNPKKHTV